MADKVTRTFPVALILRKPLTDAKPSTIFAKVSDDSRLTYNVETWPSDMLEFQVTHETVLKVTIVSASSKADFKNNKKVKIIGYTLIPAHRFINGTISQKTLQLLTEAPSPDLTLPEAEQVFDSMLEKGTKGGKMKLSVVVDSRQQILDPKDNMTIRGVVNRINGAAEDLLGLLQSWEDERMQLEEQKEGLKQELVDKDERAAAEWSDKVQEKEDELEEAAAALDEALEDGKASESAKAAAIQELADVRKKVKQVIGMLVAKWAREKDSADLRQTYARIQHSLVISQLQTMKNKCQEKMATMGQKMFKERDESLARETFAKWRLGAEFKRREQWMEEQKKLQEDELENVNAQHEKTLQDTIDEQEAKKEAEMNALLEEQENALLAKDEENEQKSAETNKEIVEQLEETEAELKRKSEEIGEKDKLLNEKDQLISEKDQLIAEKDQLLSEQDESLSEKDQLLSEKDQLISGKDELLSEKDELLGGSDSKLLSKVAEKEAEMVAAAKEKDGQFLAQMSEKDAQHLRQLCEKDELHIAAMNELVAQHQIQLQGMATGESIDGMSLMEQKQKAKTLVSLMVDRWLQKIDTVQAKNVWLGWRVAVMGHKLMNSQMIPHQAIDRQMTAETSHEQQLVRMKSSEIKDLNQQMYGLPAPRSMEEIVEEEKGYDIKILQAGNEEGRYDQFDQVDQVDVVDIVAPPEAQKVADKGDQKAKAKGSKKSKDKSVKKSKSKEKGAIKKSALEDAGIAKQKSASEKDGETALEKDASRAVEKGAYETEGVGKESASEMERKSQTGSVEGKIGGETLSDRGADATGAARKTSDSEMAAKSQAGYKSEGQSEQVSRASSRGKQTLVRQPTPEIIVDQEEFENVSQDLEQPVQRHASVISDTAREGEQMAEGEMADVDMQKENQAMASKGGSVESDFQNITAVRTESLSGRPGIMAVRGESIRSDNAAVSQNESIPSNRELISVGGDRGENSGSERLGGASTKGDTSVHGGASAKGDTSVHEGAAKLQHAASESVESVKKAGDSLEELDEDSSKTKAKGKGKAKSKEKAKVASAKSGKAKGKDKLGKAKSKEIK
eukprot:Platyproteum_vivax@DN7656_c0_g1_i5.p1